MLPYSTKKTLCQSLVQSHLDYSLSSWYAAMTQKAKNKLQVIQNKITRFILDLGPRTHITTEHMADLNTLKLPEKAKQLRLNTTHMIYFNEAPTYLQKNFNKARDRAQHTRGSHWNFVVPNANGAESNTFYYNAIKDWNKFPTELKTCENIASFKKGLRSHLLQMATEEEDRDFNFVLRKVNRIRMKERRVWLTLALGC